MEFDPFSSEFFEDPYEVYRWLRDEEPVHHNERLGFWAVSRYEDCVNVHRDVATFTSTHGLTIDQLTSSDFREVSKSINSMIMLDPPTHNRMRKLVSRAFTPRRIAGWEPVVHEVIDSILDELAGATELDVVADFSGPFPVEVICSIVGVPEGDRQQIRHWTDRLLEREVGNPFPTAAGIEAAIASAEYMQALIRDKRRNPSDDMIGDLIEAEVERDDGTGRPPHRRRDRRVHLAAHGRGQRDRHEAGGQRGPDPRRAPRRARPSSRPTRRTPPTRSRRSSGTGHRRSTRVASP